MDENDQDAVGIRFNADEPPIVTETDWLVVIWYDEDDPDGYRNFP